MEIESIENQKNTPMFCNKIENNKIPEEIENQFSKKSKEGQDKTKKRRQLVTFKNPMKKRSKTPNKTMGEMFTKRKRKKIDESQTLEKIESKNTLYQIKDNISVSSLTHSAFSKKTYDSIINNNQAHEKTKYNYDESSNFRDITIYSKNYESSDDSDSFSPRKAARKQNEDIFNALCNEYENKINDEEFSINMDKFPRPQKRRSFSETIWDDESHYYFSDFDEIAKRKEDGVSCINNYNYDVIYPFEASSAYNSSNLINLYKHPEEIKKTQTDNLQNYCTPNQVYEKENSIYNCSVMFSNLGRNSNNINKQPPEFKKGSSMSTYFNFNGQMNNNNNFCRRSTSNITRRVENCGVLQPNQDKNLSKYEKIKLRQLKANKKKFAGNPINKIIEQAKNEKKDEFAHYLCNQSKENYLIKAIKDYDETYINGVKSQILDEKITQLVNEEKVNPQLILKDSEKKLNEENEKENKIIQEMKTKCKITDEIISHKKMSSLTSSTSKSRENVEKSQSCDNQIEIMDLNIMNQINGLNRLQLSETAEEFTNSGSKNNILSAEVEKKKKFYFFTAKQEKCETSNSFSNLNEHSSKISVITNKSSLCCSCKHSNCLKLYCECFKNNQYCKKGTCTCKECFNLHEFEILRQKSIKHLQNKSKMAFKSKKIDSTQGELHYKGCFCKSSGCKKNYCECFQNKVRCSDKCRCTDCKNPYNNSSLNHTGLFQKTTEDFANPVALNEFINNLENK